MGFAKDSRVHFEIMCTLCVLQQNYAFQTMSHRITTVRNTDSHQYIYHIINVFMIKRNRFALLGFFFIICHVNLVIK
jgi:hypothetical protein